MAIYIDVVLSGWLGIMGMRLESRRQSRSQFCANFTFFIANDLDDPDRPASCKEDGLRAVFFITKKRDVKIEGIWAWHAVLVYLAGGEI